MENYASLSLSYESVANHFVLVINIFDDTIIVYYIYHDIIIVCYMDQLQLNILGEVNNNSICPILL